MGWWERAMVKSVWIINGRLYIGLLPIIPRHFDFLPVHISRPCEMLDRYIGVKSWETYALLSLRRQEYNDFLLLWLIFDTVGGHKETMNIGYGLLPVHHRQKGYPSISMGTNLITGLCIAHSSTSFIISQILDEMLDIWLMWNWELTRVVGYEFAVTFWSVCILMSGRCNI